MRLSASLELFHPIFVMLVALSFDIHSVSLKSSHISLPCAAAAVFVVVYTNNIILHGIA